MTTVELQLDDAVLDRARRLAAQRTSSLDEVVAYALERLDSEEADDQTAKMENVATPTETSVSDQLAALHRLLALPHPPAPVLSLEDMSRESIYD